MPRAGPEIFLEILDVLSREIGWRSPYGEDNEEQKRVFFLLSLSLHIYFGSFLVLFYYCSFSVIPLIFYFFTCSF